jgi:LytS/YehU family sensor histidine kinase
MLPFLENSFKHGLAEQLEKPWLSVDISLKSDNLQCKIANSKNELITHNTNGNGIGITNVKKRLSLMYPNNHELKMHDEGIFFEVCLIVKLTGYTHVPLPLSTVLTQPIPT